MILKIYTNITKVEFNVESKLEAKHLESVIHKGIDILDPNRYSSSAFRIHHTWDGYTKMYNFKEHFFPNGLYDLALDVIKNYQKKHSVSLSIKDYRQVPVIEPYEAIPDKQEVTIGTKKIIPREEQVEAVRAAFDQQRGLIDSATNSGKTLIASMILKYANSEGNFLFIAPSANVMNQAKSTFEDVTGEKVGTWQGDKIDIQRITCVMARTLANRLKDPSIGIKLKSKKDIENKQITKNYVPLFKDVPNTRQAVLSYFSHYIPKYNYEEAQIKMICRFARECNSDLSMQAYMNQFEKDYNKALYKLGKKKYDRYYFARDYLKTVTITIVDECHHAASDGYQSIFRHLENSQMMIGLSGTIRPEQETKYHIIKAYLGSPITEIRNYLMIKEGISATPHIKELSISEPKNLGKIIEPELNQGKVTPLRQYQLEYKYGVIENEYRNKKIAELSKMCYELNKGACLVVVNSIEHGTNIGHMLDELKVPYAFLKGDDDTDTRQKVLDSTRDGTLRVLLATKIIDEGLDTPNLQFLIYASAGSSPIQLLQRIGRILRLGKNKKDVFVYDIVDKTSKFLYNQAKSRHKIYLDEKFDIM